jgi:hypothetical protein
MIYGVYDIFDDKQCKKPHIFMLWKAEDTCLNIRKSGVRCYNQAEFVSNKQAGTDL